MPPQSTLLVEQVSLVSGPQMCLNANWKIFRNCIIVLKGVKMCLIKSCIFYFLFQL